MMINIRRFKIQISLSHTRISIGVIFLNFSNRLQSFANYTKSQQRRSSNHKTQITSPRRVWVSLEYFNFIRILRRSGGRCGWLREDDSGVDDSTASALDLRQTWASATRTPLSVLVRPLVYLLLHSRLLPISLNNCIDDCLNNCLVV